jgi:hypothetical protein
MKSFLLYKNKPTIKWSMLKNGIFFEGNLPGKEYALAICPSENIIILDVDNKNDKNGFLHIPPEIFDELLETFYYSTKSGGAHFWIEYTGNQILLNTSTKYGLDLRIGAKPGNAGGYVKYHHNVDIRECIHLIKPSSNELNLFLEQLFMGVKYDRK